MDNIIIYISIIFGAAIFGPCIHMFLIIFAFEIDNYFKNITLIK